MSEQHVPNFGGSIPENYERYMVPLLFADYAADLASRLEVPAGGAVLETACGTGAVTRHLRARLPEDVRLTITDLAPAMVERAREVVGERAGIEYRQADATALPFADGAFDAVICQFGVMFFPDKAQGMREAARVLKPGGRFVFNVWDRLERNVLSQAVHEAVAEVFPHDPPRFLEVPFSWHDLSRIVRDLQAAGFGRHRRDRPAAREHGPRCAPCRARARGRIAAREPGHRAGLARTRGCRSRRRGESVPAIRIGPDQRPDAGVPDRGAAAGLTWRSERPLSAGVERAQLAASVCLRRSVTSIRTCPPPRQRRRREF